MNEESPTSPNFQPLSENKKYRILFTFFGNSGFDLNNTIAQILLEYETIVLLFFVSQTKAEHVW